MSAAAVVLVAVLAAALVALAIAAWRRRRARITADDRLVVDAARTYARDHDGSQIVQLLAMLEGDQQQ